jgi:DNA polymerase-3 subunit delta'
VLLENIERMTPEATNAFLKSCEEPLARRIIIATTGNKTKILETILSRAIALPFVELSQEEMVLVAKENNIFNDDTVLQEVAIMMAMGRPGSLLAFHELLNKDDDLKQNMQDLIKILPRP